MEMSVGYFVYCLSVLVINPGPALLSIVGAGSTFGFKGELAGTFGALLSANTVIMLSIIGFASILTAPDATSL